MERESERRRSLLMARLIWLDRLLEMQLVGCTSVYGIRGSSGWALRGAAPLRGRLVANLAWQCILANCWPTVGVEQALL